MPYKGWKVLDTLGLRVGLGLGLNPNTAKRCELIKPGGLNRYHVHTYEFMALFRSLYTLN